MPESRGSIVGAVGSIFAKAKQQAFSYVQQMIDDQITKKLAPYLATGVGLDGNERSDVVVNENGDILIENCWRRSQIVERGLHHVWPEEDSNPWMVLGRETRFPKSFADRDERRAMQKRSKLLGGVAERKVDRRQHGVSCPRLLMEPSQFSRR